MEKQEMLKRLLKEGKIEPYEAHILGEVPIEEVEDWLPENPEVVVDKGMLLEEMINEHLIDADEARELAEYPIPEILALHMERSTKKPPAPDDTMSLAIHPCDDCADSPGLGDCVTCGGGGWIGNTDNKCEHCSGTGVCPTCKGQGVVLDPEYVIVSKAEWGKKTYLCFNCGHETDVQYEFCPKCRFHLGD